MAEEDPEYRGIEVLQDGKIIFRLNIEL